MSWKERVAMSMAKAFELNRKHERGSEEKKTRAIVFCLGTDVR